MLFTAAASAVAGTYSSTVTAVTSAGTLTGDDRNRRRVSR
jgi:hypothetical protein